MRPFRTLVAIATIGIFAVAACGNDADETATTDTTTTTTTTEAEQTNEAVPAYCERAAGMDQNALPSEQQLQELVDVAPPEIKEDLEVAAAGITERGLDAFSDPAFAEAVENIETWEKENCPGAGGDDEEEQEEEEAPPQTPDPDATRVAVTATDFEFDIEGNVPAEKVAFVMTNQGEVPHHMSILKLKEGTTAEQADRSFQDATIPELIEAEVGQSSNAAPGEEAVVNAELEPGLYLMVCFVEEPDGVPHAFKGMRTVFEVS